MNSSLYSLLKHKYNDRMEPSYQAPQFQPQPQPQVPSPQPPQFQAEPAPARNTALLVSTIVLAILAVAFAGTTIWAYMNYTDQKTDVDGKIALAVADAKKKQADDDQKKYNEILQNPYTEFVGPDDYGRLTFNYPKTWSVYVAKDVSQSKGGSYEAYLNPVVVPPVNSKSQYALHLTISDDDYASVLKKYESLVKSGKLKSSTVSANGQNGTRYDGNFTKDIRGAAVVYKIRDKTLVMQTDADTFKPKFEEVIKTIKFNT